MPEKDLQLDYYLVLKNAPPTPNIPIHLIMESIDELTLYSVWDKKGNNYLKLGAGYEESRMGILDKRAISYAFATLWQAMDEFYSEVFSDLKFQSELDKANGKTKPYYDLRICD